MESKYPKPGHPRSKNSTADQYGPMREHHLTARIMRIEMHLQQRTNVLQIATRKQLTSSADEEVAINIQSDSIVRQTNKVHLTP